MSPQKLDLLETLGGMDELTGHDLLPIERF
jgi:hypothetical protein